MKKIVVLLAALLGFVKPSEAQFNRFVRSGVVDYQKNVNMFAVVPKFIKNSPALVQEFENYKKNQPQILTFQSRLTFSGNQTLYEPIANPTTNTFNSNPIVTQNNTVFNNLSTGEITAQKNLFGTFYLLKDQHRKIKWKLTDETRDIAGFPCRRANGLTADSVYVVAFYTSKIPVPGGPESFSGLPGMILQLAVPRENVSWIATNVSDKDVPMMAPPARGSIITYAKLREELKASLVRLGETAQIYLKAFML